MRSPAVLALALFLLSACGGGGGDSGDRDRVSDPSGFVTPTAVDFSDLRPFNPAGSYAAVLKGCVTAAKPETACTLETLPLLGLEHQSPGIPEVMDRVVVSHDWMGERLREVLGLLPGDLQQLMRGVTAVVVDDDVRPSYYSRLTGAIYLDPASLWLSNEEKADISRQEDFRSGFGEDLGYLFPFRYVKGNAYAYSYYPLDGPETRQLQDILLPVARVLYHELAHANDQFPPADFALLVRDQSVLEASERVGDRRVAARLQYYYPLASALLRGLAEVRNTGRPATGAEKALTPAAAAAEFAPDGANDEYNYFTTAEDVAMLFEETMMRFRFGVERDAAFTAMPLAAVPRCDDLVVAWGVRGRIGEPGVKERARFVAAALLPGEDLAPFFDLLPLPVPMRPGEGWCSNLSLTAEPIRALSLPQRPDQFLGDLGPGLE